MIGWIVLAIFAVFVAVLLIRAARFHPVEEEGLTRAPLSLDEERIAKNLSDMVRCKTVSSYNADEMDDAEFDAFRALLKERYPLVHKTCTLERVARNGLLYHWKGKASDAPAVLMAHYDVVPVREEDWEKPPFSGIIEEGVLWGRGAIDTKVTLAGVMEGAEYLLQYGFTPEQDIYFCFGGDEESSSLDAPALVETLRSRNIRPAMVLDEGGAVVSSVFPGVKEPCALIGAGEKGLCNLELRAVSKGGHASTPPKHTALGELAQAISSIEAHPMKASFPPPTREMFDILGRRAPFAYRILFANMGVFSPLLKKVFSAMGGELNAMCRTTTAFTMASGSNAPNVLPAEAAAVVNCRISGADSLDSLMAHCKKHAGKGVSVRLLQGSEPTPYADTHSAQWKKVATAIHGAYPDAVVAPYVMLACSDSRHYCAICDNVMRFSPLRLTKEERGLIHAANERLPIKKAADCAAFYVRLMEQL